MESYKKVFQQRWESVVCDKNGKLILDKVMRELSDYSTLYDNCSLAFDLMVNISNPFSNANQLAELHQQKIHEMIEEHTQPLEEEIARLQACLDYYENDFNNPE